jgi:hypothetical protein
VCWVTVLSPEDEMLVRFRDRRQPRSSLAPAGRAPELLAAGFLPFENSGRGCFQLSPAGIFGGLGRSAPNRAGGGRLIPVQSIAGRLLGWKRRILTSDKSTVHALDHMRSAPLHNPPETVDADLSLRGNRKPRLLTTGLALGNEIFVRSSRKRENEKDKTQSKGRSFHDRPFRRKYQEIEGPISSARRFGTVTNWHVHRKKRRCFQPKNKVLASRDFTLTDKQNCILLCSYDEIPKAGWIKRFDHA